MRQVLKRIALLDLLIPPIVGVLRSKWRDRNRPRLDIPNPELYRPIFSPWLGGGEFGRLRDAVTARTLVSADRLWVLYCAAKQMLAHPGDFVECGVYRGGTARMFAELIDGNESTARRLHLFDTFAGMPATDPDVDKHMQGDFSDTDLATVQKFVGQRPFISWHVGRFPETFAGVPWKEIALLHIDVDIKQSVLDTLDHLFSKVRTGGLVIFDDYGFSSCVGARLAVDQFFSGRKEVPIVLPTGQALVIKQ